MAPAIDPVILGLPLKGPALVQNSPANRVPSHGTDLMASTYAIDLVPVDAAGQSSRRSGWRALLASEPAEDFVGFGAPVLAPVQGTVEHVHDGEPDHPARRSQLALVPYMLGQAVRLRQGTAGLAGNYVVITLADRRAYLALVHLQRGSILVRPGDTVRPGQRLGSCGNSGNSTEPHVHLQVMDGPDPMTAHGIPIAFSAFQEHHRGTTRLVGSGLPASGSVIEPVG